MRGKTRSKGSVRGLTLTRERKNKGELGRAGDKVRKSERELGGAGRE